MTSLERTEALRRAAAESLERLRRDQRRVEPALGAALAQLAVSAFSPSFRLKDLTQGHGERWLWRRFQAELGCTPKSYLENLRLETAGRLLTRAEPPVYDVAEQVGYRSTETFIHAFTAWAGLSPSAWRRRSLAERPATTQPDAQPSPIVSPTDAEREKRLLAVLAPHLLTWTSAERRALATHGYRPSRRALLLALLEECYEDCQANPEMGLELLEIVFDLLEDLREENATEDLAELEALAMICLRQQERRRKTLARAPTSSPQSNHL